MIHRRDNTFSRQKTVNGRFVLIAIVAVSAFVLLYVPVRLVFSKTLYAMTQDLWHVDDGSSDVSDGFFANFRIKRSLVYKNRILEEEIERMQTLVLDRNLLQEKILRLEEALGREGSDDRVSADVLVGPGRLPYDILVVNAGSMNGVHVGDAVVYSGSGVVGVIAETFPFSAKVKLYTSPGDEHSVLVGEHFIPGVAHGRGMGNFEVNLPKGSPVLIGDIAVLASNRLVLGVAGSIEDESALPFIKVLFRTTFNINDIRSVEIVKSANKGSIN